MLRTILICSAMLGMAFNAGASGFNGGQVYATQKFFEKVKVTQPNQVGTNFGIPDDILVLKDSSGSLMGVMWIYRQSVLGNNGKLLDAEFVLVDGLMKYVSLAPSI